MGYLGKTSGLVAMMLLWLGSNVGAAAEVSTGQKGYITRLKRMKIEDAYTPKVLGLFIGISDYKDVLWHDLKYPKKDVADMVGFFENSDAMNLDYKAVLTTPEKTTRDYILNEALDAFEMKNTSEKDIVIAYISGHGTLTHELLQVINSDGGTIPVKRPYIVTSDTREGKVEDSAISMNKITDWFDKLRSRRKILILDLCHSGLGKSQISPEDRKKIRSAKGINYTPIEDSWASIILSACSMGGTSYEDDKLKNSVYTHFLLKGMGEGDLNGDGAVTISEAHNYAIDRTRQYTWEHKGVKQVPTAYSKILGKDPIRVSGRPATAGAPVLFSYNSSNTGVELYVDNVYQGMLPKGIKINPGEHTIECRYQGRTVLNEKMKAAPGNEYMLPQLFNPGKFRGYLVLANTGYRTFVRSDVSKDLLPDIPHIGTSIYYYGRPDSNLAWSGSLSYGTNEELTQYTVSAGLKYTTLFKSLRLFAGPELMISTFSYNSDFVGHHRISDDLTFVCPGADLLFTYEPKPRLMIAGGLGTYYLPYKLNDYTSNLMMNQLFLSVGYGF